MLLYYVPKYIRDVNMEIFSRDVKHVGIAYFLINIITCTNHKRYNLSLNTFVRTSFPKGI